MAAEFGRTVATVNNWVRRGLPFVKRGGRRLFDIQDVRNWLAAMGLVPGARGVQGGKKRAADSKRQAAKKAGPEKAGPEKAGPEKAKSEKAKPEKAKSEKAKPEKKRGRHIRARGAKSKAGPFGRDPSSADQDAGGQGPGPPPRGTALGLEAALGRVEAIEEVLGRNIYDGLTGRKPEDPLAVLAGLQNYEKVLKELRQVTKGLIEVQQARKQLIDRDDVLETLAALAVFLRTRIEGLPREVVGSVVTHLADAGVEVSDLAAFQRALQAELQEATDRFLEELSREAAGGPARLGITVAGNGTGGTANGGDG